jgi:hypothetical protein
VRKRGNVDIIEFDDLNTEDWKCLCAWCVFEKQHDICITPTSSESDTLSLESLHRSIGCITELNKISYKIFKYSIDIYELENQLNDISTQLLNAENEYDTTDKYLKQTVMEYEELRKFNKSFRLLRFLARETGCPPFHETYIKLFGSLAILYYKNTEIASLYDNVFKVIKHNYMHYKEMIHQMLYYGECSSKYRKCLFDGNGIKVIYYHADIPRNVYDPIRFDKSGKSYRDRSSNAYKMQLMMQFGRNDSWHLNEVRKHEEYNQCRLNLEGLRIKLPILKKSIYSLKKLKSEITNRLNKKRKKLNRLNLQKKKYNLYCYECNKYKGTCIGHTAEPDEFASAKKMNALTTRVIQLERELREIKTLLSAMISPQCTAM